MTKQKSETDTVCRIYFPASLFISSLLSKVTCSMKPSHHSIPRQQFYLVCLALIMLFVFLGYVFLSEHKYHVDNDPFWIELFEKNGLSKKELSKITHDENVWYHNNKSTCVGFGEPNNKCILSDQVCCGGLSTQTFGDYTDQVKAVILSISSEGGKHPDCPLLY